jgi:hypothetical protein
MTATAQTVAKMKQKKKNKTKSGGKESNYTIVSIIIN